MGPRLSLHLLGAHTIATSETTKARSIVPRYCNQWFRLYCNQELADYGHKSDIRPWNLEHINSNDFTSSFRRPVCTDSSVGDDFSITGHKFGYAAYYMLNIICMFISIWYRVTQNWSNVTLPTSCFLWMHKNKNKPVHNKLLQ